MLTQTKPNKQNMTTALIFIVALQVVGIVGMTIAYATTCQQRAKHKRSQEQAWETYNQRNV